MKIETSELQGAALDWAVAKCEGIEFTYEEYPAHEMVGMHYSTDWSQGGPIIEREGLCLSYDSFVKRWNCSTPVLDSYQAETPLIAAMRCYVASKLGDTVEIPEELK
jgi:hypothetical protein